MLSNKKLMEFIRWGIVGVVATAIHYGIYYLLKEFVTPQTEFWLNIDYTLGYVISFFGNFFLSAYFTFHEKPSLKKGFGFGIAHAINYGLHILFLNVFLLIGFSSTIAPIFVFILVVPINFLMVRFVFKKR
ncbi:GtrA family protein [bacterium]|nr:GtrA family protein [bacterium]